LRGPLQSAAVDLDVVFLGTSGATPTAQRAPAATLVRRGGERVLFDCAEGTQRQLLRCDIGLLELQEVFLTHFHADHYLGLRGLPDGPGRVVLQHGERLDLVDGTRIEPTRVLGPPREGRKRVLTGDTAPAASVVEAAAGADLLVHEATFLAEERERARETLHST